MIPEIRRQNEDDVPDAGVVQAVLRLEVHAGRGEVLAQDLQGGLGQERQLVGHLLAVVPPQLSGSAVHCVLEVTPIHIESP